MGQIISELVVHNRILDPIRRLQQGGGDEDEDEENQHRLIIFSAHGVNRQSLQYLVDFLLGGTHQVMELELYGFSFAEPSDGGLDVLKDLFANGNSPLTTVKFQWCNFGSSQEASQVIAAMQSNRLITDLTIRDFCNLGGRTLEGTALGNCISGLLMNMPQLQRLELRNASVAASVAAGVIRALQPGLRQNCHLKELRLICCQLEDEGVFLLVEALVGNTVLEVLNIGENYNITSNSLPDITRLMESSRLKEINLSYNSRMFGNVNDTLHFARALSRSKVLKTLNITTNWPTLAFACIFPSLESNKTLEHLHCGPFAYKYRFRNDNPTEAEMAILDLTIAQLTTSLPRIKGIKHLTLHGLQHCIQDDAFLPALHKNTSLLQLPGLDVKRQRFPQLEAAIITIYNILRRNCYLAHADSLLALQPTTGMLIDSNSGIWHAALVKLTSIPGHNNDNNDHGNDTETTHTTTSIGASAVFKILRARPVLLLQQAQVQQRRPRARLLLLQESHNDDDDSHESTIAPVLLCQQVVPANDNDNTAATRPMIATCTHACLVSLCCRGSLNFDDDRDDE